MSAKSKAVLSFGETGKTGRRTDGASGAWTR
jgi:hypothetical protein